MTTALTSLYETWGLGTSEIAAALNTSSTVIRWWRNGGEPNADEVARADRLDAFLHQVHDYGIAEPAAWMSAEIVEGYTVTRWHIYRAGQPDLLVRNAELRLTDGQMLDLHDTDWRRAYWTSFKTVEAADGGLSVVGKSYDDVRAQMPEVA